MKYETYDLGHGLHICPEIDDCLIFNAQVVHTSIGKLLPPKEDDMDVWERKWDITKGFAELLIRQMNHNNMSEEKATQLINKFNTHNKLV